MKLTGILAEMFSGIIDQLRVYDTNKTITIDGFSKDDEYCLNVNSFFKTIYCVELARTGNSPVYMSDEQMENIFNDHRNDDKGYLIWALLKKDLYQRNYIFTFSKQLAERFEVGMGARKLHALEIINAIYDLFLDNEYGIQNKNLKPMLNVAEKINYENPFSTFNSVIKEAVYGNAIDADVFQSYQFLPNGKAVDLYDLFKMDYTGALFTYVSFSKSAVKTALDKRISESRYLGTHKQFKELLESYDNGDKKLALINSVLFLKKGYKSSIPGDIGNKIKTTFVRKQLFKKDIIRHSPLKKRDVKFDRIVDSSFFHKYFVMVHKINTDVPDFYGKDLMGGFVNYGLRYPTRFVKNTRPHTLILGPTGSGKTTTVGKIMSSMLEVDYNTWFARKLHAKYFRAFDIKNSMRELGVRLATNPKNDIKSLSADLNLFRYNLVNVSEIGAGDKKSIDLTELAFASDLLSVIVETLGKGKEDTLSAEASGLFKELLRQLYENKNYVGVAISSLLYDDPVAYHNLIKLGYKDYQLTTDTVEPEYEYLRKPVLNNLINEVKQFQKIRDLSEIKRQTAQYLESKLDAVNALGYFSGYDRIDLKTGKYLYFNMDAIKDVPEFIPIFLAIFNKVYTADKKRQEELRLSGKPRPEINYIFEEANNYFIVEAFKPIFMKLAAEARSYDIVLIFVTQRIESVPAYIFTQIESKIILFPAAEEKNEIIKGIKETANPPEHIMDLFEKTPQFGMTIWYEHGGFVMKFELDEIEQTLFESEGEKISAIEARG